ncbi:hypothetical protein [Acetobacter estunensis]|uniref:hypothetical protein n=1 Tax=Acetobacter estunensis TaxID=104097 RepID=UPI0020C3E52C|nr:hypothetical protein [Acetobacter estunensis]
MLILKPRIMCGLVFLTCGVAGSAAHAVEPPLDTLDCRHLFVEDVRLSDQLDVVKRKEAADVAAGTAEEDQGFYVKFDPVPGVGIMKGMTLSPAGKPIRQDTNEMGRDALQARLLSVRHVEQNKLCPEVGSPAEKRTTILDDQVRGQ